MAAGCMLAMTAAHAQFVSLGGLAGAAGFGALFGSDLAGDEAGDATPDIDSFVRRSAAISVLAGKSVAAINAAFYHAQTTQTRRLLDSGAMRKQMARLDAGKRKMLAQALYNVSLGSLQAAALG